MIEGNVQLSETRTARPGEAPMVIRGQRVHVTEAGLPSAAISVTGASRRTWKAAGCRFPEPTST